MPGEILIVENRKNEKFLRRRTADFDFRKFTKKEIDDLIVRMRRMMRAANGIGLSANQIGLDFRAFVAEVPDQRGGMKFYAVFNPKMEKIGSGKAFFEEGCLSIPGKWGDVERADKVILSGMDKNGKSLRIKAWGLLARVFQHEMDHLDGKLFIDKAKKVYSVEKNVK